MSEFEMSEVSMEGFRPRSTEQLRADVASGMDQVSREKTRIADYQADLAAQKEGSIYSQMKEVVDRQSLEEAKNLKRAQDAVAGAIAISRQHGGKLPKVAADYLNRQFGFDGKNIGLMEGGFDPQSGDFVFTFGERDSEGNMAYRQRKIPRIVQYGLAQNHPDIFSQEDLAGFRDDLARDGYSSAEIDVYSRIGKGSRGDIPASQEGKPARASSAGGQDKIMAVAQKQIESIQKQMDSIQDPKDPRLAKLQQNLNYYENVVKLGTGAAVSEWSASLGLDPQAVVAALGSDGADKTTRKARQFEGEREIRPGSTITRDSHFGLWGGEKVPRIEDDTRTGEKVVKTKDKDSSGNWVDIRLKDGQTYFSKDSVYVREGDQVFMRPKEKFDVQAEVSSDKDGVIFKGNGNEALVRFGDVVEEGGQLFELVGDSDGYSLVPTTKKATVDRETALARAADYRKGQNEKKKAAYAKQKQKDKKASAAAQARSEKALKQLGELSRVRASVMGYY